MSQITDYYQDGSTPEEIAFLTGLRPETIIEHLRNQGEMERQVKPRDESIPVTRINVVSTNLEHVAADISAVIFAEGEQVLMLDERRYLYCHRTKSELGMRLKRQMTPNNVGVYDARHIRDDLKEDIKYSMAELRSLRTKKDTEERRS